MDFDVIVIGAGAAGLMCAAVAGQRGRRVLLLDHAAQPAEKIRISGGGRCNFTNRDCGPGQFLSRNAHFCRSALARYGPQDFLALLARHRIAWHEKTLGQLFCDESATQVVDMLRKECAAGQVHCEWPVEVTAVERLAEGGFRIATAAGSRTTQALVVATGGLSIPKAGASPFGYRLAEQFGLPVVPPRPALVPLAADPAWLAQFGGLSGTAFEVVSRCPEAPRPWAGAAFREAALITHRGLSGPAILQISSYWQAAGGRGDIELDLWPDLDAGALGALLAEQPAGVTPASLLARSLPRRLAQALAQAQGWDRPLAGMARRDQAALVEALKHWRMHPAGTLGYAKAEVTLGGVDTDALNQQTMAARAVPGLHFIGEVVDVTGWLGGYNFQWAWSSAQAAGQAV